MPAQRRDLEWVKGDVAVIFEQAQSGVNPTKDCVELFKIHNSIRHEYLNYRDGRQKAVGEHAFNDAFLFNLLKTFPCKRGDVCANRIARFAGAYFKLVHEKADEEYNLAVENGEIEASDDETFGTRLTSKLLRVLLPGFVAKDKNVRYRAMYALQEMVGYLGALEQETYDTLRQGLIDRLDDKDSGVRALAVACLARICKSESRDEVEGSEPIVQDYLLEALSTDPAGEVRKAILSHIPLNPTTIRHIMKQGKHKEPMVRKSVYVQALKRGITVKGDDEEARPGPTHPRELTSEDLENIINQGLQDRDPQPRNAAIALVNEWIKILEKEPGKAEPEMESTDRVEKGVLTLLELLVMVERKPEELVVAERLLKSIFSSRTDIVDNIKFQADYWEVLGPVNSIFARVFADWCIEVKAQHKLDTLLPEITDMVKAVKSHYSALVQLYQRRDEEDEKVDFEEIPAREFILGELLKLAAKMDYADSFGKKHMLALLQKMLVEDELPKQLLPPCLDVLREVAASERDFIRIVVELIQDLRDSVLPEGTTSGLSAERQSIVDDLDTRCLSICIHMLERVESKFEKNSTLEGLYGSLINQNLAKNDNPRLVEAAVKCRTAPRTLRACLAKLSSEEELSQGFRILLFQTVFDLLLAYASHDIYRLDPNLPLDKTEIQTTLVQMLAQEQDMEVLTVICEGLMKLFFYELIDSPPVLITLLTLFINPDVQHYPRLIQSLQYFFNAYSLTSSQRQDTMRMIFIDAFKEAAKMRDQGKDTKTSVELAKMFEDWTNPEALEDALPERMKENVNYSVQLDMARDIIKELLEKDLMSELKKEDKKALYQCLTRLHLPDDADDLKLMRIKLLLDKLNQCRPPRDNPSIKAWSKFENEFTKKYEAKLEGFTEEDARELDELNELFDFLDDIIPEGDTMLDADVEPRTRGQKRRSRGSAAASTDVDDLSARESSRARSKRPRYSTGTEDDAASRYPTPRKEEWVEPVIPARSKRSRGSNSGPPPDAEITYISSGEDEPPALPKRAKHRRSTTSRASSSSGVKQEECEEDIDADMSYLLRSTHLTPMVVEDTPEDSSANYTKDSLFDSDDDEEEEEEGEEGGGADDEEEEEGYDDEEDEDEVSGLLVA
ncbi:hypothetical protein D9611_004773 [Ephemerocybe angulata]|uniref:Nuclear condensin complex subunit 3 C-terminal domain-containing protein n=1 Tax=Ephemerocybe angulata TaxID=980116 RepID=A0A8H5EWX4_9AGAR|nr:hypothetical protein D9611_004773 [Tulosesus angulatus]